MIHLTCPCNRGVAAREFLGVIVYQHTDADDEDCPYYSSMGRSLDDVFLAEFASLTDARHSAMFLASYQVRLVVFESYSALTSQELTVALKALKATIADALLRERILQECCTLFGYVFNANWEKVCNEPLHRVQTVPGIKRRIHMQNVSGGALDSLSGEIRAFEQRRRR